MTVGTVWLVGGGPGDPGLITVRGVECLARADVVVFDRLIDRRLLDLAPAEAERISVGKLAGSHTLTQEEINDVLVAKAREGKRVVRLKGGDPFVFGRGGEEAAALAAVGVSFEVVPGVTSAVAVPAYAGIPVTQRGLASSFAVVTGHEDPSKAESSIDWERLATGVDTLVFLMGAATLPEITKRLIAGGRAPDTPAACVQQGTTPGQRTVSGTLAEIARRVEEAGLEAPLITVVGHVAALRDSLRWFDTRPLFGKRVLVTRAETQAGELSALLAEAGAEPIELPAIEITPRANRKRLRETLERLDDGGYDWAVFTSANGVDLFFRCLARAGKDARALRWARVCAIGPGTAAALARHGIVADLLPERFVAEGVVEALSEQGMMGNRVLWVRARGARRALAQGLTRLGAMVDELPLYSSTAPKEPDAGALARLRAGEVDIVTFASSSAVRNLVKMLGGTSLLEKPLIACIGPVTARTVRRLGLRVDVVAAEYSFEGLMAALKSRLSR